jgi:pectate lyase
MRPATTWTRLSQYHENILVDHVSASWSVDETLSIYHCENVTAKWSLLSESLYKSVHEEGAHGFGRIWACIYGTYHHLLLAQPQQSPPAILLARPVTPTTGTA